MRIEEALALKVDDCVVSDGVVWRVTEVVDLGSGQLRVNLVHTERDDQASFFTHDHLHHVEPAAPTPPPPPRRSRKS